MSVNIRYPNITGLSDSEQLVQIKSYLYQLVEQLNYALPTIGSGEGTAATNDGQGGETYTELKSYVAQEFRKINSRLDKIEDQLNNSIIPKVGVDYFTEEDKEQIVNEVLAALESTQ